MIDYIYGYLSKGCYFILSVLSYVPELKFYKGCKAFRVSLEDAQSTLKHPGFPQNWHRNLPFDRHSCDLCPLLPQDRHCTVLFCDDLPGL